MRRLLARSGFLVFLLLMPAAVLAVDCAKLDRRSCRNSPDCSLDCHKGPNGRSCDHNYFCREKNDPCEKGFTQTEWGNPANESVCKARAGCQYQTTCYCGCDDEVSPPCDCACGGELPRNCLSKK